MGAAAAVPLPAKLIVGMLSARSELLAQAGRRLTQQYGPIDLTSGISDFDFTDYYRDQMGPKLLRQFISFDRLIPPEAIAAIKQATGAIEAELAAGAGGVPPRPVNLDPGYVTESKLVLASTKDFAHRVYLGGGIFAEVTLTYVRGRWRPGPHTFPDYACGSYGEFLSAARNRLHEQLAESHPRR